MTRPDSVINILPNTEEPRLNYVDFIFISTWILIAICILIEFSHQFSYLLCKSLLITVIKKYWNTWEIDIHYLLDILGGIFT
jgi:hypothetical protein